MGRFVVRRGGRALITLLVATLVFHLALTVLPGDPVRALFGFRPPPPELAEELRRQFRLDEPYVVQYLGYLGDLVRFDLGRSLPLDPFGEATRGSSVNSIVATAWAYTARLLAASLLLQAVVGVVGGVLAAVREGSAAARGVVGMSVVLIALPVILTAYVLQVAVGLQFSWVPFLGATAGWRSYVLPVLALTGVTLGTVVLFLRSELRRTLRSPFIHYATACGIRRPRIVGVHALRVALPPVMAYLATNLGQIVMGVLIVEGIFGLPGLGGEIFEAIRRQDRSLLASLVTLITFGVIIANLLTDLTVSVLDPRVRLDDEEAAA